MHLEQKLLKMMEKGKVISILFTTRFDIGICYGAQLHIDMVFGDPTDVFLVTTSR